MTLNSQSEDLEHKKEPFPNLNALNSNTEML